jgi:phage repressor protein C with HTH and peptisase S24 domain
LFAISERDRLTGLCEIADMAENEDEPLLYRQLLAIKPMGLTRNQWLIDAGVNRSFFSDLKKRGRARSDIIDKVIEAAGMSPAQFYALNGPETSVEARKDEKIARQLPFMRDDEPRDVPVLGTAMGTDFEVNLDGHMVFSEVTELDLGEITDHAPRPPALRGRMEVYALIVSGESMSPRHRQGDGVYVDPKAQPRVGDDVVLYLRKPEGDGERVYSVLIKELVRSTSSFVELYQHTPNLTFTVTRSDIFAIHRVIPWRELMMF